MVPGTSVGVLEHGIGQARGISANGLPLGVIAILGLAAAIFSLYAIPAGSPFVGGDEGQAAPRPFTRGAWQFGLLAMAVAFGLGGFEVSLVLWILEVMRLDAAQVSRLLVECTVVMMVVQATMFFLPAARPRWKPAGAAAAFAGMAAAVALTPLATGAIAMSALVAVLAASNRQFDGRHVAAGRARGDGCATRGKADGKKMMNMDQFMKSCDMDHDGMMSKAEMLAHMEKMFDKMDARKSGKLDKKQTEEFLKQLTAPSGA